MCIATISKRHQLLLALPVLYEANQRFRGVDQQQLEQLYNRCVRRTIEELAPEHISHWPYSYAEAYTQYRDHRGNLFFSTIDIPAHLSEAFGEQLLEKVHGYSWGRRAYFIHQLRGTKGYTTHDPDIYGEVDDAIDDVLTGVNRQVLEEDPDSWFVDVGLEVRLPGHILQWTTLGFREVLRHTLPDATPTQLDQARRKVKVDMSAQIADLAGFRLETTETVANLTGVHYINAYSTDKAVTYQLHNGIYRPRKANCFYPKNISQTISDLCSMEETFAKCAGTDPEAPDDPAEPGYVEEVVEGQEGAVRLEVRVSFGKVREALLEFPQELLDRAVIAVHPFTWWYVFSSARLHCISESPDLYCIFVRNFKLYRVTAMRLLAEYMSQCPSLYRKEKPHLTLTAILTLMLNALNVRPSDGQAERELTEKCCQQVPDEYVEEEHDDDFDNYTGNTAPILYRKGLYNIAGIVLGRGDSRIHFLIEASDRSLAFMFGETTLAAIQCHFDRAVVAPKRTGASLTRIPNKRLRTYEVRPDDYNEDERPNFSLAQAGVKTMPGRILAGRDVDYLHAANISLRNTDPRSVDEQVTTIWLQFVADLFNKAPNKKHDTEGSHLLLTVEQRLNATDALLKTTDLREIFANVQFKVVSIAHWDQYVFSRLFPSKTSRVPFKTQNYKNCVYWQNWRSLMTRMTDTNAYATRQRVQARFNTLSWVPSPDTDRIWQTKRDDRLTFRPADARTHIPCPHIVLNPHLGIRDVTVNSHADIRAAARTEEERRIALREEEEESSEGE